MKLGIPVYEGVNLLDVAGPLEMFYWAGRDNNLQTVLVSADGGAVTSLNGVRFEAQASFAQTPSLDVLWVPGGKPAALEAIRKHKAASLIAVGGAAYLVAKAIRKSRVLAFGDLGMEAIYEFEVKDMPVTVAVDANGTSVHQTGPAEWKKRIKDFKIPVALA